MRLLHVFLLFFALALGHASAQSSASNLAAPSKPPTDASAKHPANEKERRMQRRRQSEAESDDTVRKIFESREGGGDDYNYASDDPGEGAMAGDVLEDDELEVTANQWNDFTATLKTILASMNSSNSSMVGGALAGGVCMALLGCVRGRRNGAQAEQRKILEKCVERLTNDLAQSTTALEEAEAANKKLQVEVAGLRQANREVECDRAALVGRENLEQLLAEAKASASQWQEKAQKLESVNQQRELQNDTIDQQLPLALQRANEELTEENERLRSMLEECGREREAEKRERDEASKALQDIKINCEALERDLTTSQSALTVQLAECVKERLAAEQEVVRVSGDLAQLKGLLVNANAQLLSLKTSLGMADMPVTDVDGGGQDECVGTIGHESASEDEGNCMGTWEVEGKDEKNIIGRGEKESEDELKQDSEGEGGAESESVGDVDKDKCPDGRGEARSELSPGLSAPCAAHDYVDGETEENVSEQERENSSSPQASVTDRADLPPPNTIATSCDLVTALQAEAAGLRAQLGSAQGELRALMERCEDRLRHLQDDAQSVQCLVEERVAVLSKCCDDLSGRLKAANEQSANDRVDIDEISEKMKSECERFAMLKDFFESEMAQARQAAQVSTDALNKARLKEKGALQRCTRLQADLEALQAGIGAQRQQAESEKGQLWEERAQLLSKLEAKGQELATTIVSANEREAELQSQLSDMQATIADLEAYLALRDSQLAESQAQFQRQRARADDLAKRLNDLQSSRPMPSQPMPNMPRGRPMVRGMPPGGMPRPMGRADPTFNRGPPGRPMPSQQWPRGVPPMAASAARPRPDNTP